MSIYTEIVTNIENYKLQLIDVIKNRRGKYFSDYIPGWCNEMYITDNYILAHLRHLILIGRDENYLVEYSEPIVLTDELKEQLTEWLTQAVQNEVYGGIFYHTVCFEFVTNNDESFRINVTDEKRLEILKQRVLEFIEQENTEIQNNDYALFEILNLILNDLYSQIHIEQLKKTIERILEQAKDKVEVISKIDSFLFYRSVNYEFKDEELPLNTYLYLLIIKQKSPSKDAALSGLKRLATKYNYQPAKAILEGDAGNIDKSLLNGGNELIKYSANDILSEIKFTFKEVNAKSLGMALTHLLKLLEAGFPHDYLLETNIKGKDYLPIKGFGKTKANLFWNKCAEYSEIHPLLRKYIEFVIENPQAPYIYYPDTEDEFAISIGGYAAFALGMADENNHEIVEKYLDIIDDEHCLTPDFFLASYINKFGITDSNENFIKFALEHINGGEFVAPAKYRAKIEFILESAK